MKEDCNNVRVMW